MLQAYKTMIRAEREGEKKVNMNPSNLVSDIPYPNLWIIFSINEEWNEARCRRLTLASL